MYTAKEQVFSRHTNVVWATEKEKFEGKVKITSSDYPVEGAMCAHFLHPCSFHSGNIP